MDERKNLVILFGGRSGEHPISCVTAAGVLEAVDRNRFRVIAVGIDRNGGWHLVSDDPNTWRKQGDQLPEVTGGQGAIELPRSTVDRRLRVHHPDGTEELLGEVDVIFPLLHGPYGEDGTLQGALELLDIAYVGPGVLASSVGMDKHFTKIVLEGEGIPTAPHILVRPGQEIDLDSVKLLGLPLFVKPARAGSSLGISKVTDLADLDRAVAAAQEHDPKVLIEGAIVGREIECAVLGGRGGAAPRTSLPGEIVVVSENNDFYDFETKYLNTAGAQLHCPADLPEHLIERVQQTAARTFTALDCEGLARVDVFVTEDERVIVNEINTMPGFTPISMFPKLWMASGMDYTDLVSELVELALERPTSLR